MKRITVALLSGILFLTACGPTPLAAQATPTPVIEHVTAVPSPTATQTLVPSPTRTASITPLPTIPTFTPTFDVSTIVTVTPAPKAECPKEDNSVKLNFKVDHESIDTIQNILDYLNKGGSIKAILSALPSSYYQDWIRFDDLTGDGIPEFAYVHYSNSNNGGFHVFTCLSGKYILYKNEFANSFISLNGIYDMNLNGVPELVTTSRGCSSTGCYRYFILEWDGSTFLNLAPEAALEGVVYREITDINNDGILELILRTAPLPIYVYQPWQEDVHVFSWDGKIFAPQTVKGYQFKYRFQVIQDADLETALGSYNTALNLYKKAIFNNNLNWWSKERQTYENAIVEALWINEPTPSIKPIEDNTEYPRLAAYAYYRIMLIHLMQNHESDAGTVYNTLQQKFGDDPYGHPYVEMATKFWDAYQSTHKMYDGCAAAIQYAVEHPEILTPLGSDYHGWQSHTYVPEDVCPFR